MCGIVGYAGGRSAAGVLLDGLKKLEYRGYDSAGICVSEPTGLYCSKCPGPLQALQEQLSGITLSGTVGIGHTRWATHGAPCERNSHPQLSWDGQVALVHNGIIENEAQLRQWLWERQIPCRSDTDSEVIANLIGWYLARGSDPVTATRQALARLEGSYALGIIFSRQPDTVLAVKKDSPLVFGFGEEAHLIASDVSALLEHTRQVLWLEDGEMALFDARQVTFYNSRGAVISRTPQTVHWEAAQARKDGFEHFLLKEIMEQPKALADTILPRLRNAQVDTGIRFDTRRLRRICLVGCGSAYYAALLGKYLLEAYCHLPADAVMASEFRYAGPAVDERTTVILISQSGETADTLAALKEAKRLGAQTLSIVNVTGSALARLADQVLYTRAGPEISVATTKAFSAQLAALQLITVQLAQQLETISREEGERLVQALAELPRLVKSTLSPSLCSRCRQLAEQYRFQHDIYLIGRNLDSPICMEGSLKLKEVAYVHGEAYPAGELKHGPIAMLEQGSPVIAVNTVEALLHKTASNIREVQARGAQVLCIVTEDCPTPELGCDCIAVAKTHPILQPGLSLLPLQLLAYYMALGRGIDPDKPRNLAKSVTVE